MLIEWDQSLSVGIDKIDGDHKKLLDIINVLGAEDDKTSEELTALVDELTDYSRYHFDREEELMAANGYANLERHQEEHGDFIAKLLELAIMLDTEDSETTRNEAAQFLFTWLSRHIRISDMDYVSCVLAGGVDPSED